MQTPAQKAVLDRLTALRARTGRPGAAANDGLTAALPAGERAQLVALVALVALLFRPAASPGRTR